MKKYNLSEIMKRAWEIKKENKNNIFGICLKMAWKEAKEGGNEMKVEEYLNSLGYRTWEKGDKKRVYMDGLENVKGIEEVTPNPKSMRKVSMYYDVINDSFNFSVSSSRESVVRDLIEKIRKDAAAA